MTYYAKDHFRYFKWGYTNNPKDKENKIDEEYSIGDVLPEKLGKRLSWTNPYLVTTKGKKKSKGLTYDQIKDMTKGEQKALLHKLGHGGSIPRYEKDRIKLIMELQ